MLPTSTVCCQLPPSSPLKGRKFFLKNFLPWKSDWGRRSSRGYRNSKSNLSLSFPSFFNRKNISFLPPPKMKKKRKNFDPLLLRLLFLLFFGPFSSKSLFFSSNTKKIIYGPLKQRFETRTNNVFFCKKSHPAAAKVFALLCVPFPKRASYIFCLT